MTDQLTRDQLLQQRLWAAAQDCDAVGELLTALSEAPPHAGTDQEERMRGIENSLSLMQWGCKKLREYATAKDVVK